MKIASAIAAPTSTITGSSTIASARSRDRSAAGVRARVRAGVIADVTAIGFSPQSSNQRPSSGPLLKPQFTPGHPHSPPLASGWRIPERALLGAQYPEPARRLEMLVDRADVMPSGLGP